MTKLTRKQKIEIYERRKKGESVSSLTRKFNLKMEAVNYLIRLIDLHGFDILRTDKNKYYSISLKQKMIDRILIDHQSIRLAALDYGLLSRDMLENWIHSYQMCCSK